MDSVYRLLNISHICVSLCQVVSVSRILCTGLERPQDVWEMRMKRAIICHNLVLFHFPRRTHELNFSSFAKSCYASRTSSRKRLKREFKITRMIITFCFYDVFLCFCICVFLCFYAFSCGDSAGGLNCVGDPLVGGFPRATWRVEPFMWWAERIK